MVKIFCVKWGTKYGPEYVNRLWSMLERHSSTPFEFYCYTDDDTGLVPWIHILPIEDDSKETWWYKLDLLNHEGNCLLFDLDVLILNDPIRLMNYETEKPTLISSRWKNPWSFYKGNTRGQKSTLYNSSVVKWNGSQGKEIYNFFSERDQEMMLKYSGIDRMLWNEDLNVDTFDKGIIYSYWLGNEYPDDIEPEKYREGFEVCIFNHEPKMDSVTGWPLEYWK
jgi:hypothetical protein